MTILETTRLLLRNLSCSDLPELHDYRSNETCRRYQRSQPCTETELRALVAAHGADTLGTPGSKHFAIAQKTTGQLIGDVFVCIAPPTLSLGYTISYKHHRQGCAYELLSALIERLHAAYPTCEIVCCVEPENAASIALLQKLGFGHERYMEKLDSLIFSKWPVPQ